jgi:hypothetical protein
MAVEKKWTLNPRQTAAYHVFRARDCKEAELVDDRTWSELEMDAVFDRLDKSITPLGAQYLYSLLRTYRSAPEPVSEWAPLHRELKAQPAARQNLRGALGRMDRQDTADLAGFILGPPQTVPQHWKWYYFLPGAMIVSLLGLFFNHWFLFPAVAIGFFNIFVHYRHGQAVERHGPLSWLSARSWQRFDKFSGIPMRRNFPRFRNCGGFLPRLRRSTRKSPVIFFAPRWRTTFRGFSSSTSILCCCSNFCRVAAQSKR